MRIIEICCGSYYDALMAHEGGADRIELNSALKLGGLTPTLATLALVKEHTGLNTIAMLRPRGAGFCYLEEEFEVMERECRELLKRGADGIAFGCLKEDASLDEDRTKKLVSLIKSHGKVAVFHRAFDCTRNPYKTLEALVSIGVDRVLTSGLKPKAEEGIPLLKELQQTYGSYVELIAASNIHADNAVRIMDATGISQVHSSCKTWLEDKTTVGDGVSYSFWPPPYEAAYDAVSKELAARLVQAVKAGNATG